MRIFLTLALILVLVGCSSSPCTFKRGDIVVLRLNGKSAIVETCSDCKVPNSFSFENCYNVRYSDDLKTIHTLSVFESELVLPVK